VITQVRSPLTVRSRWALVCAAGALAVLCFWLLTAATAGASSAKVAGVGAVYTQTNDQTANSVVVFNRLANGKLQKRESVSTGGKGSAQAVGCGPGCPILDSQTAVVVSDNGKLVFAVNAGSNTVTSFRETPAGLKRVSQVASGGSMPESLALHGSKLYVLNVATGNANGTTGNIYGYRVSPSGGLTPIGSSQPLANAAPPDHSADARAIGFKRNGKVLVVTEIAGGFMGQAGPPGRIDTFVVGADGKAGPAVSHPSAQPFPFGFEFDNRGHLVVSSILNPADPTTIGGVATYNVSDAGVVTPLDTKSAGGILPCWVVVTNDGRHVYVVNTGAGHPAPVTWFSLSKSGVLTPRTPAAGSLPGEFARTDAALSRDSKFLYVLAPQVGPGSPSHIDAYRLAANGSMKLVGSTPAGANLGKGATGLAAR
jgi:6-phosphogluconolactonase